MTEKPGNNIEAPQPETKGLRRFFLSNTAASFYLPLLFGVIALFLLCHIRDVLTVCQRVEKGNDREAISQFVLLWLVVPSALVPGLIVSYVHGIRQQLMAGAAALALVVLTGFAPAELQYVYIAVPIAGIAYFLDRRWRSDWEIGAPLAGSAFALVMILAAKVRHLTYGSVLRSPLDPDSIGYQLFAQRPFSYETEFREPGYIWALKLTHLATGGDYSSPAMRLYGLLFSLIAISVLFFTTYRLFGLLVAWVGSLFFACSYELAMDAVRVLREDLIIASVLAYLYLYLKYWRKPIIWPHYLALGLTGAAGTMLRVHGLSFYMITIVVHFAVSWLEHGRSKRQLVIAAVALVALFTPITPYLVYCSHKYKNAMFVNDFGMRFYANYELAGVDPRFPTKAEVAKDAYAGGPMKTSEYLFKYHTIGQVVRGCFAGMWRLYAGELAQYAFRPVIQLDPQLLWALVIISLGGTVAMLFSTAGRIVTILLFLFHAPSFYLVQFKWFDPRLLTAAFVGFYIAVGVAILYATLGLRKLVAATATGQPAAAIGNSSKSPRQKRRRATVKPK